MRGPMINRRTLLTMSGAGLASRLPWQGYTQTPSPQATPVFTQNPFSLGVASGDPLPDGVVIWTKLAPDPLVIDGSGGMPAQVVPVRWEIAEDDQFHKIVQTGASQAVPEFGHALHVDVEGLAPAREYFYRFKVGTDVSPVGRTKTAPAPGAPVSSLAFATTSCQHFPSGYFNAHRHLVDEDIELVLQLGDYIYESAGNVIPLPGREHIPPYEPLTLPDFRLRYSQYKTDVNLQAAHAAFPWVVAFDDHEVDNNWAGAVDGATDERGTGFYERRVAALQAYYEFLPLRRSSLPQGPNLHLYRRLTYGDLIEFNMFDTRQYRDDQVGNGGVKPPSPEQADQQRTILGTDQEQWLYDGLTHSRALWNVLAQQVFFAQRDFLAGPDQEFSMDAWDGYLASRDHVLDFVAEHKIANPVVLSGDVHKNYANNLLSDFNDPDSSIVGTEFVGTSMTSFGDGSDMPDVGPTQLSENPHIKFINDQRGYLRCHVTRDTFQADYRVVPYVTRPDAPISTRASFVTEQGHPGVEDA